MAGNPSETPLRTNPAVQSNLTDPPTLAPAMIGTGVAMAAITTGVVAARLNANFHADRKLGWDDCFCILALLLTIAYTGLSISFSHTARHEWDVPISFFDSPFPKVTFAQTMVYGPSIFFARAAILALYFRVFAPRKAMRILICAALLTLLIFYLTGDAVLTAYCTPKNGMWDVLLAQRCTPAASINAIIQSVVGILSDIFILILPLPITYKLNLRPKTKAGVIAIFLSGIFALAVTSLGLYYRVLNWKGTDRTWAAAKFVLCAFAENNVVIIVSCVPAIAPYWRAFLAKWVSGSASFSPRKFLCPLAQSNDSWSHRRWTGRTVLSGDKSFSSESCTHFHNGEYIELSGMTRPKLSSTASKAHMDSTIGFNNIKKSVRADQSSERSVQYGG